MQIYEVSSDPETLRAGKCRKPLRGRIRQAAVRFPGLFSFRMRRFPGSFSLRIRCLSGPTLLRTRGFPVPAGAGGADAADGLSECSSRAGPRADPRTAPGWPAPDGFSAYLFGPRRCALFPRRAAAGQPMSFSSCRSVASGKSVRKWSRMRTNDSAGVQSAISSP